MRKFKFLSAILSVMVFIGSFAACNPNTSSTSSSSSQEPTSVHTCESVCPICNKCTDTECTEDACADKCQGHTQTPAHTCESVCPTCNKCTDTECTETVCADKCQGHTQTPAHTCESVCPTCNKCTDTECTETVCADKCQGHTQAPAHTCANKCNICGLCMNKECTEEVCEDKCSGHVAGDPNWEIYELKFISFNVKIPGTAPAGLSWSERSPHILNFLNNSGAHVIGLQEVSGTPRGDISGGIASNYEFVNFSANDATNLAMIYDKTVFDLVRTEKYWLSDTPDVKSYGWDAGNYRALATLILQHRVTGEVIRAMNTHGPVSDAEGNIKGFKLIAERSLSTDTNMLTIMTGDFNANVKATNLEGYPYIAEKLQDCRVSALESPNREHNTFHDWGANTTEILDYCFVTRSEDVEVLNYQVHSDAGSIAYLSDHYPISSTVRVYNPALSWTEFY